MKYRIVEKIDGNNKSLFYAEMLSSYRNWVPASNSSYESHEICLEFINRIRGFKTIIHAVDEMDELNNTNDANDKDDKNELALFVYKSIVNKIDDFFEYANESKKDREKVHFILDDLSKRLQNIYKSK